MAKTNDSTMAGDTNYYFLLELLAASAPIALVATGFTVLIFAAIAESIAWVFIGIAIVMASFIPIGILCFLNKTPYDGRCESTPRYSSWNSGTGLFSHNYHNEHSGGFGTTHEHSGSFGTTHGHSGSFGTTHGHSGSFGTTHEHSSTSNHGHS